MWPWDHLAIGYVLYSVLSSARGESPGGREAVAVAVGTQFPDLVDKPLGWVYGFPTATGLTGAHSLFVAIPLSTVAIVVARRYDAGSVGLAFAVGYLSHLPADAVYPILFGGDVATWFLFWPLVPAPPLGPDPALVKVELLVAEFLRYLESPRGALYIFGEVALLTAAVLLWLRDGVPGLPWRRPA